MITNRIGNAPAVRQSAPQRQKVAFGTGCSDIHRVKKECRDLEKLPVVLGLAVPLTILSVFGLTKVTDPQNERPQKAVMREVSDSSKAKEFIKTSKSMNYFTARDYLIGVADSASGSSKVSPSKKFAEALTKIKK